MKWIEFIGIPGSGKSSASRILKDVLLEKGKKCWGESQLKWVYVQKTLPWSTLLKLLPPQLKFWIAEKVFNLLKFREKLIKDQIDQQEIFALKEIIDSHSPANHRREIFHWLMCTKTNFWIAETYLGKNDYIVVPEGFYNRAISIFLNLNNDPPSTIELQKYLGMIPAIHMLIKVKESLDWCISINTMEIRNKRTQRGGADMEVTRIRASKSILDLVLSNTNQTSTNIYELDNTKIVEGKSNWGQIIKNQLLKLSLQ